MDAPAQAIERLDINLADTLIRQPNVFADLAQRFAQEKPADHHLAFALGEFFHVFSNPCALGQFIRQWGLVGNTSIPLLIRPIAPERFRPNPGGRNLPRETMRGAAEVYAGEGQPSGSPTACRARDMGRGPIGPLPASKHLAPVADSYAATLAGNCSAIDSLPGMATPWAAKAL